MKIDKKGAIIWGKDEPSLRSCWFCNGSHKHLKKANYPIMCFSCGRILVYGKVLQESKDDDEARTWIEEMYKKENGAPAFSIKQGNVMVITDSPRIKKALKKKLK